MSRTPLVTVGIVVLVAVGVTFVLTAGTALVAAAGQIAGDFALGSDPPSDSSDSAADTGNASVPGVTANGTANISAVLESHRSALSERGYVAVTNATRRADGSVIATRNQTYRATENGSNLLLVERETDGQGATSATTVWANDSYRFTREATDGADSYDVAGRVPVTPVPPTTDPFAAAFSRVDGEFVVTDAETVDGHRVVTLAAPLERTAERDANPGTLTLRVDDRGIVRNATATRSTADGTERMTYRLVDLGVESVRQPDWTANVSANATESERSPTRDRLGSAPAASGD
ncbi:hypothetical protein BV210_00985 [Halorientalis sp. IM1011]|uniref:hypothetical protein n=1 Tax=Halorientalis sp. IM1011 TaxID=1932360 RepID=UPI00097CC95E|nr:hypothetical protein [Halorientalis sp. IM1011]AQL41374.1 hypothetical protein BV210_00985 [Halorientalis sp. IM1011]